LEQPNCDRAVNGVSILKTKMNVPRICFLAILLLALDLGANSQVPQEAVLVDEYSYSPPCDDFLGRLDAYLGELRNHPDWTGVVVLRNTPSKRHWSAILQATIESWLDFREFDRRQIEYIRADGNEHVRQFWRLPKGARKPSVERIISGFQMSDAVTKPFLLTEETKFGPQICPAIDEFAIFAGFLKDNPTARGNIVVRDDSPSVARRNAARIIRKLEKDHAIQRKRIRSFIARFERPSNHYEAVVEYWYLP
jgi:hypothetical protein